jgi:hypothetical protein
MGGAPAWDLRSLTARGEAGADYHRLLLALDAPIDVYVVDQPPDLAGEIAALHERQLRSDHPLLADVLSEIADYLTELGHLSGSRAKQVVWAVAVAPGESARGVGGLDIGSLLRRDRQVMPARRAATLTQAVDRARRLANGLDQLGGTPAPRLLEAEEIAQLLYGLADARSTLPARRPAAPSSAASRDARVERCGRNNTHDPQKRPEQADPGATSACRCRASRRTARALGRDYASLSPCARRR